MPITSHQMSGMIGGQQAMFGNFASYSQQISPGFQGQPPTYANPMAGASSAFSAPPVHMRDPSTMSAGPQALSAVGNIGLPAVGTAAMLGGMFLPGMAGKIAGSFDPFTMGLRGIGAGSGLSAGGAGIMANAARIGGGGVGSILRAGLGGMGGAALGLLPYGIAKAGQYGVGQMVQGAQFQNQVQGVLDQNFRFMNAESQTGYGFSRAQGGEIADMVRTMGHSDMMSGPQELLRIMKSGTQQGLFRTVQDVKEFKKRFSDMVGALKEVATTMNTTLEGAMPFFGQARQMGFWTPNDIARNAQQVRQTAATTGMSVSQTQQMMAQGAQMARSIGAQGATGATGMQHSLGLVGGGLRGGYVSERDLSEATGGLTGAAAVQSMGGMLQAGATRFARSRRARWVLAAMGRNGFTSLDPGKLDDLASGRMDIGDIDRGARSNIRQQGAFNFVNNEEELRGELLKQGPMAQLGFMRAMTGEHLYGGDERSKLITRRLLRRGFGFNKKQADIAANLARNSGQIMRDQLARGAAGTDQNERDREDMLNRSWEGIKRKASSWLDKTVKDPLQEFGAEISQSISDYFERVGNKMWGRASAGNRFRGITNEGIRALQASARGDDRLMEATFGKPGSLQQAFGDLGTMGDLGVGGSMDFGKGGGFFRAWTGNRGGFTNALNLTMGYGGEVTNDKMDTFLRMGASERKFGTAAARDAAVRQGGMYAGRYVGEDTFKGTAGFYGAFDKEEIDRLRHGMAAGAMGKAVGPEQAKALGFQSEKEANKAIKQAQETIESESFRRATWSLKEAEGKTGIELAKVQIKAIEQRKIGDEKLRAYLARGKDIGTKINLLTAASAGVRDLAGGLDMTEEAKKAGIGTFSGLEDLEMQLEERIESGVKGLGSALRAGQTTDVGARGANPYAVMADSIRSYFSGEKLEPRRGATPQSMEKLKKYGGDKFKQAIRLLGSGKPGSAERKANRKEAAELLKDLGSDRERFDDTDRATINAILDEKHPNAANVQKEIDNLANIYKLQAGGQFAEATMRRASRLFKSMGAEQGQIMGALDKVEGAGGDSIGELIRDLRESTDDPKAFVERMGELTQLAATAPEKEVAQAAEMLRGYQGSEAYVNALLGGRSIGKTMKRLTGRNRGKAAGALTDLMGDMLGGKTVTKDDIKGLRAGDTRTIDTLLEGIDDEDTEKRAREILTGMKGKGTGGLEKIVGEEVTAKSIGLFGKGGDAKDRMQIIGRLGSSSGIHQTLGEQLRVLNEILTVSKESKNGEWEEYGPPTEKANP